MVAFTCEGGDVIVLVQHQQLDLGGGAEWGWTIVAGLNGDGIILLLLTVKNLRGADRTCVTVDSETASVVLTLRQLEKLINHTIKDV